MNNVIRFQPTNSPRRMASGEGVAQILFFTGVRYQRMSEDAHPTASQTRRARGKRQAAEAGRGRKSQR
jgi:hypothetical protein